MVTINRYIKALLYSLCRSYFMWSHKSVSETVGRTDWFFRPNMSSAGDGKLFLMGVVGTRSIKFKIFICHFTWIWGGYTWYKDREYNTNRYTESFTSYTITQTTENIANGSQDPQTIWGTLGCKSSTFRLRNSTGRCSIYITYRAVLRLWMNENAWLYDGFKSVSISGPYIKKIIVLKSQDYCLH